MSVLGWRLPLYGRTDASIALILFYATTAAFMNKRSLWFPW